MEVITGHIKSDIPAYLNGDLGDVRMRQIDSHVSECDACRHALSKARAKQSRVKRAALKSAQPEKMPNLLVTRLGRQEGITPRPRRGISAGTIFVTLSLVGIAGGWYLHRLRPSLGGATTTRVASSDSSTGADARPLAASSATAGAYEVQTSSPTATPRAVGTAAVSANPADGIWQGSDSPIHSERQVVLRNSAAWKVLWLEMEQPGDAPAVNFENHIIVGLFAGEYPDARYQVSFGKPTEREEDVLISYSVARNPAGVKSPAPAHPYRLQMIPLSPKRVRFTLESPQ